MVKRYDMEKEYSLDINIVPIEEHDGAFVRYDDYAELLEALEMLIVFTTPTKRNAVVLNKAYVAIAKALGDTK